jgi:membrane protein implicated in regulation of membrane protease activity
VAVFILILLLIAAIFGVLGAVLKVALILVLSLVLAVCVIGAATYYYLRHRLREFQRRSDGPGGSTTRASSTITVEMREEHRDPPGELGSSGRDSS